MSVSSICRLSLSGVGESLYWEFDDCSDSLLSGIVPMAGSDLTREAGSEDARTLEEIWVKLSEDSGDSEHLDLLLSEPESETTHVKKLKHQLLFVNIC